MKRFEVHPTGIEPGGVSVAEEFCAKVGWERKAFMAARRNGLKVRKVSRRVYVVHDEAIAWIAAQPAIVGASR